MDFAPVFSVAGLEVRSQNKRPTIVGRFPYGQLATLGDRGKVRKETFEPKAFSYALDDPKRDVHLSRGHSFDKPVASKLGGSLHFKDSEEFLEFIATIPEGAERATHITDLLVMLGTGLITGISPGFRVPPLDVVKGAERLDPEPGNPGVFIRVLTQVLLYEFSLVTRPAYEASQAELRSMRNLETRPRAQDHFAMTQTQILTAEYDFGAYPVAPVASDLALEASTTEAAALLMIHAAWQMVETFTKRHYRALTGGKLILRTEDPVLYRLPLWPYPQTLTRDIHAGGDWLSETPGYLPETGEVRLGAYGTYRVMFGAIPAPTLKPNVVQAVHNLALYLLIHDPARREFRSQSAGDSSFTREGMMGALYGSGAAALLASEVLL